MSDFDKYIQEDLNNINGLLKKTISSIILSYQSNQSQSKFQSSLTVINETLRNAINQISLIFSKANFNHLSNFFNEYQLIHTKIACFIEKSTLNLFNNNCYTITNSDNRVDVDISVFDEALKNNMSEKVRSKFTIYEYSEAEKPINERNKFAYLETEIAERRALELYTSKMNNKEIKSKKIDNHPLTIYSYSKLISDSILKDLNGNISQYNQISLLLNIDLKIAQDNSMNELECIMSNIRNMSNLFIDLNSIMENDLKEMNLTKEMKVNNNETVDIKYYSNRLNNEIKRLYHLIKKKVITSENGTQTEIKMVNMNEVDILNKKINKF